MPVVIPVSAQCSSRGSKCSGAIIEARDAEIAGLRALIDQRRSAGFVSLEESEREIDAMIEERTGWCGSIMSFRPEVSYGTSR